MQPIVVLNAKLVGEWALLPHPDDETRHQLERTVGDLRAAFEASPTANALPYMAALELLLPLRLRLRPPLKFGHAIEGRGERTYDSLVSDYAFVGALLANNGEPGALARVANSLEEARLSALEVQEALRDAGLPRKLSFRELAAYGVAWARSAQLDKRKRTPHTYWLAHTMSETLTFPALRALLERIKGEACAELAESLEQMKRPNEVDEQHLMQVGALRLAAGQPGRFTAYRMAVFRATNQRLNLSSDQLSELESHARATAHRTMQELVTTVPAVDDPNPLLADGGGPVRPLSLPSPPSVLVSWSQRYAAKVPAAALTATPPAARSLADIAAAGALLTSSELSEPERERVAAWLKEMTGLEQPQLNVIRERLLPPSALASRSSLPQKVVEWVRAKLSAATQPLPTTTSEKLEFLDDHHPQPMTFAEWLGQRPSFDEFKRRGMAPPSFEQWCWNTGTRAIEWLPRYTPEQWHELGLNSAAMVRLGLHKAALRSAIASGRLQGWGQDADRVLKLFFIRRDS